MNEEYDIDWTKMGNVNCNQQSEKGHMIPQEMMKEINHLCLIVRTKHQQLVWIVFFMATEEVWNMLMFICCVGTRRDKSSKIGSSKSSIEQQRAWRRQLYALRIDEELYKDETNGIVEVMMRQIESCRIEEQFDWIGKAYPQEFKGNMKYMLVVWSINEMTPIIQREIKGL